MDQGKRADYVERWAGLLESQGEPRIAGRIYGHLATAQEPYLSLQELADQLGVSRASVSTNTRRLIAGGMVARVAVPGARGDHYALDASSVERMLDRALLGARAMQALAEEGLVLQPGVLTPGTQGLRQVADVFVRLGDSLEQVLRGRRATTRKRVAR